MITTLVRRVVPLLGIAALMGAVVYRQPPFVAVNDVWFHLRFGAEFLDGWSIRAPGHLSPFDSADWVPTQWLAQEGMATIERHVAIQGVMWAASSLVVTFVLLTYASARLEAAPLPAALATLVGFFAVVPGMTARPQLLSYVLIVVVVRAWLSSARDGRPRYWLIALAWVWPMLHGMWPIGIAIAAVVIAGMALDRQHSGRTLARLAIVPAASAVVAAATPLGLAVYSSLGAVQARAGYFAEWGPPRFRDPSTLAITGMVALVLLAGLSRRTMSWSEVLLLGLATALTLYTVRTGTVAAIVLVPLFARTIQTFVPEIWAMDRREWAFLLAAAATCCAVLTMTSGARVDEPAVPTWLDARLSALPAETRVLNDWDSGAYFLWRHPDLNLVMHGYGDVFTDAELRRNVDITRLQPGWVESIDELDVDYALLRTDSALGYALVDVEQWRVIETDEDFTLLQPTP
jgi:hypothetical protein